MVVSTGKHQDIALIGAYNFHGNGDFNCKFVDNS
jgi:hypothetical protein